MMPIDSLRKPNKIYEDVKGKRTTMTISRIPKTQSG